MNLHDPIQWLASYGTTAPTMARTDAYRSYTEHAERAGAPAMGRNRLYTRLRELGAAESVRRGTRLLTLPPAGPANCRTCGAQFFRAGRHDDECGPDECLEWAYAGAVGEARAWLRSKADPTQTARVTIRAMYLTFTSDLPHLERVIDRVTLAVLADGVFGERNRTGWAGTSLF